MQELSNDDRTEARVLKMVSQFGTWSTGGPGLVLLFMLCLILGLVSRIPGLKMDTSTEGFFTLKIPRLSPMTGFVSSMAGMS